MQKLGNKRGDLYVCKKCNGFLVPGNNCMSHKVVAERMVYMVTEYDFYEELKEAVMNGLREDIKLE